MAVGSLGRLHSRGKYMQKDIEINVFGLPLAACSQEPLTGFFRDGSCNTCAQDTGSHTVCAVMTSADGWKLPGCTGRESVFKISKGRYSLQNGTMSTQKAQLEYQTYGDGLRMFVQFMNSS